MLNIWALSRALSSKYSLKRPGHAKQSVKDVLKTDSKKAIQKTIETTDDFKSLKKPKRIHRKILQRQLKVKQKYQKKIYIYLQKRDKIINDQRLM